MKLEFNIMPEVCIPHLNGGTGEVAAKMYMDDAGKIMVSRIPVGASIGQHTHDTSREINYVISGTGMAYCDDMKEALRPGICHVCPKGASHRICNTGTEELVLFTVVIEQ